MKDLITEAWRKMPEVFVTVASAYRAGVCDASEGVFAPSLWKAEKLEFDAYCYGAATYNGIVAE